MLVCVGSNSGIFLIHCVSQHCALQLPSSGQSIQKTKEMGKKNIPDVGWQAGLVMPAFQCLGNVITSSKVLQPRRVSVTWQTMREKHIDCLRHAC